MITVRITIHLISLPYSVLKKVYNSNKYINRSITGFDVRWENQENNLNVPIIQLQLVPAL